jgi:hypothetical protein
MSYYLFYNDSMSYYFTNTCKKIKLFYQYFSGPNTIFFNTFRAQHFQYNAVINPKTLIAQHSRNKPHFVPFPSPSSSSSSVLLSLPFTANFINRLIKCFFCLKRLLVMQFSKFSRKENFQKLR